MPKVIVGMSGGVDSAAAAYLLKCLGYEVIGVTLRTWVGAAGEESRCCEITDARRVCSRLGIPYYVHNCLSEFEHHVTSPFTESYLSGETPNPCILCNRHIKWTELLKAADVMGAEYVATGHYAEVVKADNGRYTVKQAEHAEKDQTYMLCRLTQEQLSRTLMPLGRLTKSEVRRIAESAGLPVADKPDSQEICFVTEGSHADYLRSYSGRLLPPPGDFVDEDGNILGRHEGIYRYTVGQRRGLGIALGYHVFVKEIDPLGNRVVLCREDGLYKSELLCREAVYMGIPPMSEDEKLRGYIRVRYRHSPQPAEITALPDSRLHITLDEPVRAPAPGQSAAVYDSEGRLLCSGIIESSTQTAM